MSDFADYENMRIGGHAITFNTMRNAGRHFFNINGNGTNQASRDRSPMDYAATFEPAQGTQPLFVVVCSALAQPIGVLDWLSLEKGVPSLDESGHDGRRFAKQFAPVGADGRHGAGPATGIVPRGADAELARIPGRPF